MIPPIPEFIVSSDYQFVIRTVCPKFIAVIQKYDQMVTVNNLKDRFDFGARTHPVNGIHYVVGVVSWLDEPGDSPEKLMSKTGDFIFAFFKSNQ